MRRKRELIISGLLVVLISFTSIGLTAASEKEPVRVGFFCDRSGPTATIGVKFCPALCTPEINSTVF